MSETLVYAPDLATGLASVWHAMAAKEDRPILAAVCLEDAIAGLRLVAADNYRIAMYDVPLAGESSAEQFAARPVLPRAEVKLLRAILAPLRGTVKLSLVGEKSRLQVDWTYGVAEFRLMDGTYPNYAQVLRPKQPPTVVLAPRYLADAGAAFHKAGAGVIGVEIDGPLSPVILRAKGSPFVEVIMPVRTVETSDAARIAAVLTEGAVAS